MNEHQPTSDKKWIGRHPDEVAGRTLYDRIKSMDEKYAIAEIDQARNAAKDPHALLGGFLLELFSEMHLEKNKTIWNE